MSYLSDSDEEENKSVIGKEGIVFVIDATEPMFDGCHQFSVAIQCVENVMKNKALSSPEDRLAVILFGTEKTSNYEDYENIYLFQNMEKTSAKSILKLKELNESDFESKFGHNNQFSLAEVFSLAIEEFNQCKAKLDSKRVILFTNSCDPYSGQTSIDSESKLLREIAIIRAKTLSNYCIGFDLIPLMTDNDNNPFDVNTFYAEAFPHLKGEKYDSVLKLEPLLQRVYSRSHSQKQFASIPFHFGSARSPNEDIPEVKISVNVYNLCKVATKPTAVVLKSSDFTKIKSKTVYLTQDSGEVVPKEKISKNFSFGNESIAMTREETKRVEKIEEEGLTLLGFKPRTALSEHIHIKAGHFIIPDESTIKGSTLLFNALLKRCLERDKIPICRLTLKRSSPRFVALYPQIESKPLGKAGGFHVMYLPFKDDVREPDIKNAEQTAIKPEARDLAINIVNGLTFNYDPKNFANPVIQNHWRVIEGLALNQTIEPYDDSQTQPDYPKIEAKAGYNMYCLNQMLGAFPVPSIQPQKKEVKVYKDLTDFVKQNKLGVLTVAELKEFCKQNNINCGTKKADYIEAIRSYYKK